MLKFKKFMGILWLLCYKNKIVKLLKTTLVVKIVKSQTLKNKKKKKNNLID